VYADGSHTTGLRGTRSSSLARVLLFGQLQQLCGMGNIEAGPRLPVLVGGLGVSDAGSDAVVPHNEPEAP
jgi:hypothetical protein